MGKNKDSTLRLRPLSATEFKLKISILQQIGDFWTHFKFPLQDAGSLPEIKAWLGEAAEYSILLKKYLEKLGQGKTLRLVPGSVQEYLLNLEAFPADSRVFVKEVVHALFSNKGGYISKAVTKDFLDKHVDLLNKQIARKDSKAREEIQQYEKEVKETWNESNKLAQDIFALVESLSLSNPAYARQLVKVLHNVQGLKAQLAKFHETLKNEKETSEEGASETSSTADGEKEDDLAADDMAVDLEHLKSQEGDIKITNEELHPPQPQEPAADDAAMQTDRTSSPANDSALRRVASEVGHIQEGLQSISRDIEVLKVEDLVANPSQNRKFVDNLHHRCVAFSEGLMKDLYTLDELSLSQEERPKRKEQVKKIQSLVTTVDTLLAKLHELIEVVKVEEAKQAEEQARKAHEAQEAQKQEVHKPEAKKPEAEKKADLVKKPEELREDMIPTPKPEELEKIFQEALQESLKKKLKTELDLQKKKEEFEPELASQARRLEPFWRRMKLKPKVNVEQASDGYLVSSYIPGMRSEDVQISVVQEGNTPVLAIRGHRSPTVEELALLRRQLARSGIESDDESVLRLGFGRFGTFLEKFAIPENVDLRRISGGYEGGELRVILPKVALTRPARPAVPAYDPGFYWW